MKMLFMKISVMCMLVGHAVAAGNSEACTTSAGVSGICVTVGGCTDSDRTQGDCIDNHYCCTEAGRPPFGFTCTDQNGNVGGCVTPLGCNDATIPQGECGSGLVCCNNENLPNSLEEPCEQSEGTLNGVCLDGIGCNGLAIFSSCGNGQLSCCADYRGIGFQCNNFPQSTCSLPVHCSGTPVHTYCEDRQPCCRFVDMPGVNETCGNENPHEGVCVPFSDCPDNQNFFGNLCQMGFICCMLEKVSGQICINANNVLGVCEESCPGCSASQGDCADGLTCCTPDDFGVGDQCEVEGGTCETECMNPNENFGISTCNAPLTCCIPGLNMDCTYMQGKKEKDGVCVLKNTCQFKKNKKSQGKGKKNGHKPKQGTCPEDYMRCCPVE